MITYRQLFDCLRACGMSRSEVMKAMHMSRDVYERYWLDEKIPVFDGSYGAHLVQMTLISRLLKLRPINTPRKHALSEWIIALSRNGEDEPSAYPGLPFVAPHKPRLSDVIQMAKDGGITARLIAVEAKVSETYLSSVKGRWCKMTPRFKARFDHGFQELARKRSDDKTPKGRYRVALLHELRAWIEAMEDSK